jgi:hypothetical protein
MGSQRMSVVCSQPPHLVLRRLLLIALCHHGVQRSTPRALCVRACCVCVCGGGGGCVCVCGVRVGVV